MTLSSAVVTMSNSPLISPTIWAVEFGVYTFLTTMPCFSRKPCFCATQTGHSVELLKEFSVICFGACASAGIVTASASTTDEINDSDTRNFDTAYPPEHY